MNMHLSLGGERSQEGRPILGAPDFLARADSISRTAAWTERVLEGQLQVTDTGIRATNISGVVIEAVAADRGPAAPVDVTYAQGLVEAALADGGAPPPTLEA